MITSAADRLSELMKEKHVSCRRLSEMTGITKSSVNNYANGHRPIPLDKLQLMADALGVSAAWLIGWADNRDGSNNNEQPDQELEPLEAEFLRVFTSLTRQNQVFALKLLQELLASQSESSEPQE